MKRYRQVLSVWAVALLTVSIISCNDSSKPSSDQGYSSTISPSQQQIDQQKVDQLIQQNKLDQLKIQQQQEEQRKLAEESRQFMLAITDILEKDAEIGRETSKDHILTAPRMRLLDISECPSDFRTAYVDHIHAWEEAATVQKAKEELKNYTGLAVIAELLKPITNSEAEPFKDIDEAKKELNQMAYEASVKIRNTWQVVERIAVSYGAKLPN